MALAMMAPISTECTIRECEMQRKAELKPIPDITALYAEMPGSEASRALCRLP
jgi:hypothetical protein